ncbi:MAG: ABC transporter permease subunit [Phycisphaeraceae bacterium]|nr:ABC transporter permease subunit [Phycisphaeraceae bacterium]
MRQGLVIAQREWAAQFRTPIGWCLMAAFGAMSAYLFFQMFEPGRPVAQMFSYTTTRLMQLMIFLVPAVTMRLMSEEYRGGTIESLLTAPVRDSEVIIGKWLGAFAALGLMIALAYLALAPLVLGFANQPTGPGQVLSGLIGLLLLGAVFTAIGLFASTLTQNQIIAWLLGVVLIALPTFVADYLYNAPWMSNQIRGVIGYIDLTQTVSRFGRGWFEPAALIYCVSLTALFLFLSKAGLGGWRQG